MNTNKLIVALSLMTAAAIAALGTAHASTNKAQLSRAPMLFAYLGDSNFNWVKTLPNAKLISENRCDQLGNCKRVELGYSAPNPQYAMAAPSKPVMPLPVAPTYKTADTIFGAIGEPRGDLIKQLPLARRVAEDRCVDGVCKQVIIGYLAPTPHNLKELEQGLASASGKSNETQRLNRQAQTAVLSDGLTTVAGLAGGAVEANPIMGANPSPLALIGMTALKMALVDGIASDDTMSEIQKIAELCDASAVMSAASYNNLAVIAGAAGALPVVLGVLASQMQHNTCLADALSKPTALELAQNAALARHIASLQQQQPAPAADTQLALQ